MEGLDLDEDTKAYWYLFCFIFIIGVHDLSPMTCNFLVMKKTTPFLLHNMNKSLQNNIIKINKH